MARVRSHQEIVNELVYAVQRVVRHYGPGLNEDGLLEVREFMDKRLGPWWCDATWRCIIDGEEKDFHEIIPIPYLEEDSFESFIHKCGDDCSRCSGEYCETHGMQPCECDTADRHCYTKEGGV
jgi:hypothetical protein